MLSVVKPKDTCSIQPQQGHLMTIRTKQIDVKQDLIEPFYIGLDLHTSKHIITELALIDSGANLNMLSYEFWEAYGEPLTPPVWQDDKSLGFIILKLRIQE